MQSKKIKFVSIIWVYSEEMYGLSIEENYNLHILKIAKENGFDPYVIIRGNKDIMGKDPHLDKDIKIIDYKNFFCYIFNIIKFSLQKSIFYVNSYELKSFIVPFLTHRTIFMGHNQTKRSSNKLQQIQNFVFKFFTLLRVNNEKEKEYLISQGTKLCKIFVIPLVVSQKIFNLTENKVDRRDIVYFGNVTAKKNLKTILEAINIIKQTKPDIKLHVLGKIIDKTVILKVEELGLKNNIIFHGYMVQDKKMTNILNSILISVNSSMDEGQCVSVYDAALCGCVLCLPKIMSFEGVFKDKALFHEVSDYKQLAKNILFYLDNPATINEHRTKCIEMIKKDYSKETIEKKLKDLILKI
jgi:glycosyltransferase involved in cell wall biosynthesis